MVTRGSSGRESKRRSSWAEQLRSALSALELLAGPPVGTNTGLANLLKRLGLAVARLEHLSEEEFLEELNAMAVRPRQPKYRSEDTPKGLRDLSLDEVERRLLDSSTSKADLIALIRDRFEGATGTLARLSKAAITERLQTLIMNERGHEAISRVASRDSAPTRGEELAHNAPPIPHDQDSGLEHRRRAPYKEHSRE